MRRFAIMAMLLLAATPASAMTVAEFLTRADALKAKGMMALFATDTKLLVAEARSIGPAWRAQLPGAVPKVCPPPGKLSMTEREMMAMLQAVPPAERTTTSVHQAAIRALNARYRCAA